LRAAQSAHRPTHPPSRPLPTDPLFVDEPDLADDPSQKDGFRVVYDKECPFEMRLQEQDESPQEVGTLEAIRCRVCVQGDVTTPTAVVRVCRGR
jgi:hypothetical protein